MEFAKLWSLAWANIKPGKEDDETSEKVIAVQRDEVDLFASDVRTALRGVKILLV